MSCALYSFFYNCFKFLRLYSDERFPEEQSFRGLDSLKGPNSISSAQGLLNRWIILRTDQLVGEVTNYMDAYDTVNSCKVLREYISDLSTWYLRRSRGVIKEEQTTSIKVLAAALILFSKVAAPFIPFVTEAVYKDLTGEESVHLVYWPLSEKLVVEEEGLLKEMLLIRKISEESHARRKNAGIKVRQPLAKVTVISEEPEPSNDLLRLFLDELNVKHAVWIQKSGFKEPVIELDTNITPELKAEGEAREFIRKVQDLRKELGCSVKDRIIIFAPDWPRSLETHIKKETLAEKIEGASPLSIKVVKSSE